MSLIGYTGVVSSDACAASTGEPSNELTGSCESCGTVNSSTGGAWAILFEAPGNSVGE